MVDVVFCRQDVGAVGDVVEQAVGAVGEDLQVMGERAAEGIDRAARPHLLQQPATTEGVSGKAPVAWSYSGRVQRGQRADLEADPSPAS